MKTLIKNAHIISPDVDFQNGAVLFNGKKIAAVFLDNNDLPAADQTVDAGGKMVVPGFIDVHFHGRSGYDFCDGTQESMSAIGNDKIKDGVTSFSVPPSRSARNSSAPRCGAPPNT